MRFEGEPAGHARTRRSGSPGPGCAASRWSSTASARCCEGAPDRPGESDRTQPRSQSGVSDWQPKTCLRELLKPRDERATP